MHRSCAVLRLNVYTVQDGVIFQCLAVRMLRARECVNKNAALTSKHEQGKRDSVEKEPYTSVCDTKGSASESKEGNNLSKQMREQ